MLRGPPPAPGGAKPAPRAPSLARAAQISQTYARVGPIVLPVAPFSFRVVLKTGGPPLEAARAPLVPRSLSLAKGANVSPSAFADLSHAYMDICQAMGCLSGVRDKLREA